MTHSVYLRDCILTKDSHGIWKIIIPRHIYESLDKNFAQLFNIVGNFVTITFFIGTTIEISLNENSIDSQKWIREHYGTLLNFNGNVRVEFQK